MILNTPITVEAPVTAEVHFEAPVTFEAPVREAVIVDIENTING